MTPNEILILFMLIGFTIIVVLAHMAGELSNKEDRKRLEWYFSFNPPKDAEFVNVYMQGMRERWSPDQWRAAIDLARGKR